MIMTAGTSKSEPKPRLSGCFDSINNRLNPPFFGNDSPFTINSMVSIEAGCNNLISRWMRKHVSSKLLNGKSIKREITIESIYNPITPWPIRTTGVSLIAMAVSIAGGIEPFDCHAFTVVRACQQSVHITLIRTICII